MEVWIDLIIKFLPLILECFNKDGEEATLRRLRRLGPMEEFRLWRELGTQGVRFGERREKIKEVRAALAEASDEELLGLVQMAKEHAAAANETE